jgi:nucleoside diphosphate kinase
LHVPFSACATLPAPYLQLTTRLAEEFYVEHKGKAFFNGLVEFMTSGPIVALVLSKAGAIRAWRELMGPTNVFDARLKAPKRCAMLHLHFMLFE